jgi:hypothetical protein
MRVGEPKIRSRSFDQEKYLWNLPGIEEIKEILEF